MDGGIHVGEGAAIAESIRLDGYAVIPQYLSGETVTALLSDADAVVSRALQGIGRDPAEYGSLDARYAGLKEHAPKLRSHCYDIICRLHSLHSIYGNPVISEIGRALYGAPLVRGPVQVRIDDPSNDRILPMHQEMQQISLLTLNLWIPLVPIRQGTGGLRVIPQSHQRGPVSHVDMETSGGYMGIPEELYADEHFLDVEMNAGDGLIFHPFLFHASLPNTGKNTRWVAVARFNEIGTMPYLLDGEADLVMNRNPKSDQPGVAFLDRLLADGPRSFAAAE